MISSAISGMHLHFLVCVASVLLLFVCKTFYNRQLRSLKFFFFVKLVLVAAKRQKTKMYALEERVMILKPLFFIFTRIKSKKKNILTWFDPWRENSLIVSCCKFLLKHNLLPAKQSRMFQNTRSSLRCFLLILPCRKLNFCTSFSAMHLGGLSWNYWFLRKFFIFLVT